MTIHARQLSVPLSTILMALSLQAGLCSQPKVASNPAFASEQAQSAPLPEKQVLQGSASQTELDAYAKTTSTAPLLQGTATQTMPAEWRGFWQGRGQLNELEAHSSGDRTLNGATVDVQLYLQSVQNGTKIFTLRVNQLASQPVASAASNKPDPDIHFWHTGNQSHLLIKNGAQMQVGGSVVIGGDAGTNAVVEISRGSSLVILPAGSPRNSAPGINYKQNVNYDGNAITTSGATSFKGHYFKSDDRISLNSAQIHTDRIDIGDQTTLTNGITAEASRNQRSGYLLTRLQGGGLPSVSLAATATHIVATAPQSSIRLIGGHELLLSTRIVKIAPGIYDVETLTRHVIPNTAGGGTRQIISRYTALEPGRMIVQMTIKNFDESSRLTDTFNTSGYLYR